MALYGWVVGKLIAMKVVASGWWSVFRVCMRAGLGIRSRIRYVPGSCGADLRIRVYWERVGVVMLTGIAGGRMLGLTMRTTSNLEAYKRIWVYSIHLEQMVADFLTGEGLMRWRWLRSLH